MRGTTPGRALLCGLCVRRGGLLCALLVGCSAAAPGIDLTGWKPVPQGETGPPRLIPKPPGETGCKPVPQLDVQQLAGQVVAGVKAELAATVSAAVETELHATGVGGNLTGYQSEFGLGAVLVVGLAVLVVGMAGWLSHRREMARIRQKCEVRSQK